MNMQQEQWSARFGFLVASIGATVGLGNIWRFSAWPYFWAGCSSGISLVDGGAVDPEHSSIT